MQSRLVQLGLRPIEPTAVLLTSCDPDETGGLKELTEPGRVSVVAPSAGLDLIKAACPPGTVLVAADQLAKHGWFEVTPIPLSGGATASMGYFMPWSGKKVLFSGRIPVRVTEQTWAELLPQISQSRAAAADYLSSVNRLERNRPDLWLPAVPIAGRNANLYGRDWDEIVVRSYPRRLGGDSAGAVSRRSQSEGFVRSNTSLAIAFRCRDSGRGRAHANGP